jgi:HAD superfamily hydrolase (TIGR01450 family)
VTEAVDVDTGGLLDSTEPLAATYDLALLDLDGVVYIGPNAVSGAAAALEAARSAGLAVRFVTNNASRPPEVVADHLTRLGVPATVEEVVTSAQVAAALLARRLPPGAGVLVVGAAGLREALTAEGLVPVDSVDDGPSAVVQGFGPDVGWRLLAEATRGVRAGLFWMATNLDFTVPTVHGPAPGNGALVQVVAGAAGRGPDDVAGKPRPGAFLEAARRAGSRRPLVVGDRLDTDLEGARAAGMHGLLVLTGVNGASDVMAAEPRCRPNYLGRDLGALLDPHPAVDVDGPGRARCRDARVEVDGERLDVAASGRDALDLLRAATAAAWSWRDRDGGAPGEAALDPAPVLRALEAVEPGVEWAR